MIGIYGIRNILTNEYYIGQSRDIESRFKEHLYHKKSYIDKCMNEIGDDKFVLEILEECLEELLDEREEYYINLYHSRGVLGYNISQGGQHNIGESNAHVKLTEKDVYEIRECYSNHENMIDVYQRYKDKVSLLYFQRIWGGEFWNHVHYDVYSEENRMYYKQFSQNNRKLVDFTDEEIIELRKRYVNESSADIFPDVSDRCAFNTLRSILSGSSYKNLPIYSKKRKTLD